jgi:hypothetical protein
MSMLAKRIEEAEAMLGRGDLAEAQAAAHQLQRQHPSDPGVCMLLSLIALRERRLEQALFFAQRTRDLARGHAEPWMQIGICEGELRRSDRAIVAFQQALAIDPGSARARAAVLGALTDLRRYADAERVARDGLAQWPDAELAVGLVSVLMAMGRTADAAAAARDGLARWPDHGTLAISLASSLQYDGEATPQQIAAAHRRVGEIFDRARAGLGQQMLAGVDSWRARPAWSRDAGRPLRVGVLSPDLRSHSVAFFIEPFFEGHDRTKIQLVAFSNARDRDAVTERLAGHVHEWHSVADLTDFQLAELIAAQKVDLLLDLAGLTIGNRVPCLSLKPARVQATYCGYPDTTGLSTVDYRIVDSLTDPDTAAFNGRVSERLWRLDPCFLCYKPVADAPLPRRVNAGAASPPTFGCFNASRKISMQAATLWGRIMARVPQSRLLIKSFDLADAAASAGLRTMLERAGIASERVEILPATKGVQEHLEMYARVDVALDPFPYNGTTTTCEALLMGVPTVCLAGERHASRVGVSIMRAVGASELVAESADAYVDTAVLLAQDAARLDRYRSQLRGMLLASVLCDARGFVDRLQPALMAMAQGEGLR